MTLQDLRGWMAAPPAAPFHPYPAHANGPGDEDDDDEDGPTPIGDPVDDDEGEDDDEDDDDEEPLQVIAPQHRHGRSIAAQWWSART